jgi:hypothetical protein
MREQYATMERPADPVDTSNVLAGLAQRFAALWQRATDHPGIKPCASLQGEVLHFALEQSLTPQQADLADNDEGYAVVVRDVSTTFDQLYPQLADEIERNLHCYVGAMQVELVPGSRGVHIQFQLRDAPGLWRLNRLSASCT